MTWTDPPTPRLMKLVLLVFLLIAALLFGVWLLVKLWSLVVLVGIALLLGTALIPYVEWVARFTKRRGLAVVLVMASLLAAIVVFGLLVLPPMIDQGRDLYDRAPQLQGRLARFADERGWAEPRDRIRSFSLRELVSTDLAVRTGLGVVGFVVALFTTLFLILYFLLDAAHLKRFLYFSTPRAWHPHIHALLPPLQEVVGAYIRGQAITSAAIGVFSFVMLAVLQVPNALALAGIAMVADLIPLVGVFVLMTLMVLTALLVSPTTAVVVFGLMLAYQQFEDRVLVPRIYGAALRLPTIAVVVALLAGAQLLGVLGALVALPIAAAIRVVVEYFAKVRRKPAPAAAEEIRSEVEPSLFAPDGNAAARDQRPARQ